MNRLYFMDSARALCMLLGIPYHAALIYSFIPWRIKADTPDQMIDIFARATTVFRMPTFFIIAGFFAALIISREGRRQWLAKRSVRLLGPLAVGLATICPLTLSLTGLSGTRVSASLFSNSKFFVGHLWFLPTLFWLSLIYSAFSPQIRAVRLDNFLKISAAFAIFITCTMLAERSNSSFHALFDVERLIQYGPFFAIGILIGQDENLREKYLSWRFQPFILAAISLLGFFATESEIFKPLSALFTSQSLLVLLRKFGDYDNRIILSFVNKSFSIYLFHIPIIVFLGYVFIYSNFHPWIEFLLICIVTLIFSYVLAAGVERSKILTLLLNGTSTNSGRAKII